MPKPAHLVSLTALNGFCAVLLGALGAHGLHDTLASRGKIDAWHTAANYQLAHAIAGLALLLWLAGRPAGGKCLRSAAVCWLVGSVLFSGSIYVLALGGPKFYGPITPLGGLAFLAGWALVAIDGLRSQTSAASSS